MSCVWYLVLAHDMMGRYTASNLVRWCWKWRATSSIARQTIPSNRSHKKYADNRGEFVERKVPRYKSSKSTLSRDRDHESYPPCLSTNLRKDDGLAVEKRVLNVCVLPCVRQNQPVRRRARKTRRLWYIKTLKICANFVDHAG